jgi:hypothetical protein
MQRRRFPSAPQVGRIRGNPLEGHDMNRKQFRKARVAVKLDRINNTATCDVPGYEKALTLELMHRDRA